MNRIVRTFVALTAIAATFSSCTADATEKKIDSLIEQMTLQEKIGQLNQITAHDTDQMCHEVATGQVGSIINIISPADINKIQRAAMEQSRLAIPILIGRDVIHGFRTIFPIPLGQAATFDSQLVEEAAHMTAREATAAGVRLTFSPMVDISRDSRWGRIAESSGEDTYLSSQMGTAMVRGYQNNPTPLAACVKHFVGYGASEAGLDYNCTWLSERQLRNDYFPPFEACVKEGALTLMPSFNSNDGVPSSGNKFILQDVLRDEWGFTGCVISDWDSVGELVPHGFAADGAEAALKGLTAGVDVDMMSFSYPNNIEKLIADGRLSIKTVDEAVRNVLRLKFRLGLFENPYVSEDGYEDAFYRPETLEKARQAVVESAVLLKNDNSVLPVDTKKIKNILIAGPLADAPHDQMGTWAFDGEKSRTVTPKKAIGELYGGKIKTAYSDILTFSRQITDERALRNFTLQARNYDAVVLFLGEEAILSGEAHCLTDLNLQGSQSDLLAAARRSGRPVIAVVMAGRAITLTRDLANADAILYTFHPGTMGGTALAQILFGDETPSGKLPVTIPVSAGQEPIYYNHQRTGRPCSGSEVMLNDISLEAGQTSLGCTAYWLDAGYGPLFPFGYGLSYTTFEYSDIKTDKTAYTTDDTIDISFDLTNTGSREATEVAQVYVRDITGSVTRPVKELKAFERITLAAGEKRTVKIAIPVERLAFWNIDMKYGVEAGDFNLWVAGNSADGEPLTFSVQ